MRIGFLLLAAPGLTYAFCSAGGTVIDALTGNPIARAQVVANTPDPKGASTDPAGKWTIADLPCGALRFTVHHYGYLPDIEGQPRPDLPVTLVPGFPAPDLLIRLTPESVIAGRVLNEGGEPVPGALITTFVSVVSEGRRTMLNGAAINADSQGEYRLGSLRHGRYLVCARSSQPTYPVGGGSPMSYVEKCHPDPHSPMTLAAGALERADLILPSVVGARIRGLVRGAPEGARVVVQIARREGTRPSPVDRQTAQIPQSDRFEIPRVVPGSYLIEATAVGDGKTLLAVAEVDVGASDIDGVELTFAPTLSIAGSIRPESAAPAIVVVNPVLIPSDPTGYAGVAEWNTERTSFTISNVAPGRYRMAVSQPAAPFYLKSVMLDGQDVLDQELTITAPLGPIEIVVADDAGILQGGITDSDGKQVPGEVMLIQDNRRPVIARSVDGSFTIRNLPPGDYKAYAFDDSRNVEYADAEWMRLNLGAPVAVHIDPKGSSEVLLVRQIVPSE